MAHGCLVGIMAALASRLKASRTQQAEGVDAARTQPAGRGTDQKRARACTKESPYVFEPEMPRWIAQELREKRQAIAAASRGAGSSRMGAPAHFEAGFRLSDLKDILNIFLYFQFNLKLII